MTTSFELPVTADGRCDVRLPERCVGCGAAPTTESAVAVNKLVAQGRRQRSLTIRLGVPHCQSCARASSWLFWIGLIPALLGFLVVGGIVFLVVMGGAMWLGLDENARPQDSPSLVLGAFFGLLGGVGGGLLAEALARLVLLPFLGRAMLRAPLFVAQMLADADYVTGLTIALVDNGARLRLTFENEEVARAFAATNGRGVP